MVASFALSQLHRLAMDQTPTPRRVIWCATNGTSLSFSSFFFHVLAVSRAQDTPHSEEYASSIMAPVFLNKSCDPFTAPDDQCITGAYVQYSVNVTTPDHVIKTLAFAKKHNIRFVVKNTGHE